MLDSLYIKNYRNIQELQIEKLAKVNLLTGRNNGGKTSVLEALGLYLSDGNIYWMFYLLEKRRQLLTYESKYPNERKQFDIHSFDFLYHNEQWEYSINNFIQIGKTLNDTKSLMIRKGFFKEVQGWSSPPQPPSYEFIYENSQNFNISSFGLHVQFPINQHGVYTDNFNPLLHYYLNEHENIYLDFKYVDTISFEINYRLWEEIELDDENVAFTIQALQLIDPRIQKITFREINRGELRVPFVKLSNGALVTLNSMGDGVNRILNIILSMLNAKGSTLLIDEFENGLHWTVQEKLWDIILKLSKDLDVQVFATTHSSDSIRTFSNALHKAGNEDMGRLILLGNTENEIQVAEFDADELSLAVKNNTELRGF